jgi:hypothetical protein
MDRTDETKRPETHDAMTRRRLLCLGAVAGLAAVLPGCAGGRSRGVSKARPVWPGLDEQPVDRVAIEPRRPTYQPPSSTRGVRPSAPPSGVQPRTAWARSAPIPSRMNRLDRVERITVHHDGMPPVWLSNKQDVASRIDLIRQSHQANGWGDIGYHYIVDPFGQVWEGRPLMYQGAHVKDQNVRNLGVLALGNFESQRPTSAQVSTLERFLVYQMRANRVPVTRVQTHRELASTLCPGRNMQLAMNQLRSGGGTLSRV